MHSATSRSSVDDCEVDESEDGFECVIRYRGPAKKHVLVVDDCEERLLAVKRALESENDGGFHDLVVELARNGDECLEIIRDVVSMRGRDMRTAPSVVLISQYLGGAVGNTVGRVVDKDHSRDQQKGGMSGVDCCAEIRRHGEYSCMGEQFLHVVLLTEDHPVYVFDREEYDNKTFELSRSNCVPDDKWNTALDYEIATWTKAYVNATVTKTLPNNLLDADLLAAVKCMLNHLPVVDKSKRRSPASPASFASATHGVSAFAAFRGQHFSQNFTATAFAGTLALFTPITRWVFHYLFARDRGSDTFNQRGKGQAEGTTPVGIE